MNEEEYYRCFVPPREIVDEAIKAIAADTLLISSKTIMHAVTEEVGANPDKNKILWYYQQLTIETCKRVCDAMTAMAVEESTAVVEGIKKDRMRSQTGVG